VQPSGTKAKQWKIENGEWIMICWKCDSSLVLAFSIINSPFLHAPLPDFDAGAK
jgi:hypothetical protein